MAASIHTISITLASAPGDQGLLALCQSSAMGGHVCTFVPPFEADEVWSLLETKLDRNLVKSAEKLHEEVRKRGKALFSSLFDDRLRGWLATSATDTLVRLRLRYHLDQEGGALLHNLPWEWMHDGRQFLVLSKKPPITLLRELAECPPRPLMTDRICKVMLTHNQAGAEFMPIEWGRLSQTMNQSGLMPDPTALVRLDDLPDDPHRGQPLVFHYAGHGRFDTDRGIGGLVLAGRDEPFVSAENLVKHLTATGDYRLCLYNCCQGVRIATAQPYGGLATATLKAGLPACVAMYHEVHTRDAVRFADAFYRYLGAGRSLDLAVHIGRLAVHNPVAALLPCLFLQSSDDRLYGKPAPITQPPPPPPVTQLPSEPDPPWRQFENWLTEADAPIFGTYGLLEPFSFSILAREWFRLFIFQDLQAITVFSQDPRLQVAWHYVTDHASRGYYQAFVFVDDVQNLESLISRLIEDLNPGPVPVTLALTALKDVEDALELLIAKEVFPNVHFEYIGFLDKGLKDDIQVAPLLEPSGPRPHWINESYRKSLAARCRRLDPVFEKAHNYKLPIHAAIRMELIQRGEIRPIHFEDLDEEPGLVNRTLIITGLGGIGKTTLIRQWLTRRLAHDEPTRPTPLYLPLRFYRPGRLQSLLIEQGVLQTDSSAFEKHNWAAALDGYDELVDSEAFWKEWWSLVPNPARVRILITSRETADLERQLPGAPTIRVCKLSVSQIKEMVRTYEPARADAVLAFLQEQRLEAECQVPLWLLFIMLIHRIPDLERLEELRHPGAMTRGLLFQIMIGYFFLEFWEEQKRTMKVRTEVQLDVLGRIAYGMHRDGKVSADRTEIFDIVHASEAHRSLDFDTLLGECQKSQLLVSEAGMFSFPHKSFLEFFAGRYLVDRGLASGLSSYRDAKWREPLKYALGLMETDRAAALLEQIFRERAFGPKGDPLGGYHFLELIQQVKNIRAGFTATTTTRPASRLRQELRSWLESLIDRLPSLPASDATSGRHRDIELGLGTACLFPADQSVTFLTAFLERTQHLTIQVVDHLGSIADMRAAVLLLDKVMANPDERLLRRAVDTGLKKQMDAGEPLRSRLKTAVWQRILEPGSLSREQHLKRRWHLIHLLEGELPIADIHSTGTHLDRLAPEERAACLIYLLQNKATSDALRLLCETFARRLETDEQAQRLALERLLGDSNFYLRRLGAHFLRVITFDVSGLAFQALEDKRIEVRFSSLKSLLAMVSLFPQTRFAAKRALLKAIRSHYGGEEEHLRQVALGVLKQLDYEGFAPLAIEALETEADTFKVDMIHDLKFTTGFWRRVARNRLDHWRRAGSKTVREAAGYVYKLLQ